MKKLTRMIGSSMISIMLAFSSCMSVRAEIIQENVSDTADIMKIVEFTDYDMDKNVPYLTLVLSEDESIETVSLPETLNIKVEGKEEIEIMPVTWQHDGDLDNTENERYIFVPKWDETVYELSSEIQTNALPYIEVIKEYAENSINSISENILNNGAPIEVAIGSGETYDSFLKLFNDPQISGDVIVKLKSDISESISDATGDFVIPDRFTSFTIESDSIGTPRTVTITGTNYDLFANGSMLTIGEDIIIKADAIYGGNFGQDVNQSTYIEINGECTGQVFGGGKHADVIGDTKIIINGTVRENVVGGGNATPAAGRSGDINANVTGSVNIELNSGGFAEQINGGGYVGLNNTNGNAGEEYTANVGGNVSLNINGRVNIESANFSVFGGGIVKTSFAKNNVFNANVNGNVTIVFGPDAKGYNNDCIGVYGGGYATDGANGYNRANYDIVMNTKVDGDVTITAVEDSQANAGQKAEQQFQDIYGGGFANGRGADVTIGGNVTITAARKTWDSLYGGGYAEYGGKADVLGKANITIQSISGQSSNYANAKHIYGGGRTYGTYDDANDGKGDLKISQANVGGVSISIESDVVVSGDIHGGGYANGYEIKKTSNESFNKCPSVAKVQGNIDIKIADDIKIGGSLYNGGYTNINGDSSVDGSIQLNTGDNLNIVSSYYGGGRTNGKTSSFVSNAISDVEGDISVNFGKNLIIGNGYYGGGYNYNPNKTYINSINIGGKITTKFKGGVTIAKVFCAAGYVNGGNMNIANADVSGGLDYTFNGDFSCSNYYGAGYAFKSAGSMNIGTLDTVGKDIIKMLFKGMNNSLNSGGFIYQGGYVNNSKINIYGNTYNSFNGVSLKNELYGAGCANGEKGNININGSINLLFKNITSNNVIYTGGYVKTNGNCDVSGDVITEFENTVINNSVYNGGNIDSKTNTKGKMCINGSTKLIFTGTTLSSGKNGNIYGGGLGASGLPVEIKGTSIIEFRDGNTLNKPICTGGHIESKIGKSEIYIIGKQKGYLMITKSDVVGDEITGGTALYIGDGSTETLISSPYLNYIDDITVLGNATLQLSESSFDGSNNIYSLLNNVHSLTINSGGVINFVNKNGQNKEEIISGDFTGGGKIIIEAGKKLEIGGNATGTTAVEITGIPSEGDEYISVTGGGNEQFNYHEAGLVLVNNISGLQHQWILEAETVIPPNNEITGIINHAEYTQGESIVFNAVGDGMSNQKPQNNDVRWLPSSWTLTQQTNFDPTGPYSGNIDTAKLSAGNYTLSVTFKMQKYTNSIWTNTSDEEIKTIDFTIKAKSSSGGSYRPSGKADGFVVEKGKTYYYDKGKPVDNGFIFLDKDEKLVASVSADQFFGNIHNAEAVYYIKKDKTIAKHEWIILNQKGELVNTLPLGEFQNIYGEGYKIYAAREDGKLVQSWLEVNSTWYYFLEDYTARYQYWQAHWNDWYVFENYTYVCNRWIPTSEGRWYYVDDEGKMVRNQWIDGCWIDEYGIYWSPTYVQENSISY